MRGFSWNKSLETHSFNFLQQFIKYWTGKGSRWRKIDRERERGTRKRTHKKARSLIKYWDETCYRHEKQFTLIIYQPSTFFFHSRLFNKLNSRWNIGHKIIDQTFSTCLQRLLNTIFFIPLPNLYTDKSSFEMETANYLITNNYWMKDRIWNS